MSDFLRRSGYALMGSGVLLIIATLLESLGDAGVLVRFDEMFVAVLPLPPLILLLVSLPRVSTAGSSPTGGLGGIAFVFTVVGLLLIIGTFAIVGMFPDELRMGDVAYFAGGGLLLVGTLLFAVAARRAGVLPKGGGLLLALGWLGFWIAPAVADPPLFFIPALCLFGGSWIWLGFILAVERPHVLGHAEVTARERHTMPPPPPPPPGT